MLTSKDKSGWLLCAVFVIVSTTKSPLAYCVDTGKYPDAIQLLLKDTAPLRQPRGNRLPLFLWPAHQAGVEDSELQEQIIRDLDEHGIAAISTWKDGNLEKHLSAATRIAEAQKKLGLMVCVDANDCMYGFFDGSKETAHLAEDGTTFFDASIPGDQIGCPFRIDHNYPSQKKKITDYVEAYKRLGLPLDFVFGDWEIDGPLEINGAWETSQKCTVCRENIAELENFPSFQQAVRTKRCEATRECFAQPILDSYPKALVGNYGVYPNDGHRYWYDYFETFNENHPHVIDQRASYRSWMNDFPLAGYTFAMPVLYTWSRTYPWYDYSNPDYRWFYNMLLIGSNACKSTAPDVPIVPFVHWHTVFETGKPDELVVQMSKWAYQELLWHLLLRGTDSFFLWCTPDEASEESTLVHEVWSDSLDYREWLENGTPITFDVPDEQSPVVSGLRLGNRVLIRRTDFESGPLRPIVVPIGTKQVNVAPKQGCQILQLN